MTKCLEFNNAVNVEIFLNFEGHAPNHQYCQESVRWKQVTYKYNNVYVQDTKLSIQLIV